MWKSTQRSKNSIIWIFCLGLKLFQAPTPVRDWKFQMKGNEFPDGSGEEGWPKEYFFPWSHMVPLCFLTFSLLPAVGQGLFTVSNQEQDVKIIWVLSAKGTMASLHVKSLDTLAENKLAGFFLIFFLPQNFNPICKRTYLQRKKTFNPLHPKINMHILHAVVL